jgi:hypothetical protein
MEGLGAWLGGSLPSQRASAHTKVSVMSELAAIAIAEGGASATVIATTVKTSTSVDGTASPTFLARERPLPEIERSSPVDVIAASRASAHAIARQRPSPTLGELTPALGYSGMCTSASRSQCEKPARATSPEARALAWRAPGYQRSVATPASADQPKLETNPCE